MNKVWKSCEKTVNKSSPKEVAKEMWKRNEKVNQLSTFHEEVLLKWTSHEQVLTFFWTSWTSHEQDVIELWKSSEQVLNKSRARIICEQVANNSSTSHKEVVKNGEKCWKRCEHEQVMKKLWTSCEQVMKEFWTCCE